MKGASALCLGLVLAAPVAAGQGTGPAAAGAAVRAAGFDPARLARIDAVVNGAIAAHKMPGAVVVVGRGDAVVFSKAYGSRALVPAREPMTVDTIFDLASLTKVVATTTAAMILVEEGRIRLTDTVASFIPGCGKYGKDRITVRDLLTHTSGLRPDLDLAEPWTGHDAAIARACDEVPTGPPGEAFVYSDIDFILMGEIVARVSGEPLDRFAETRVFAPLGMRDTMFQPPAALRPRIAPTQRCTPDMAPCAGQDILRGVVHDPTARRMGGVAGHAGLFSTAADLTVFCRMLLDGGAVDGTRVLSPLAVARMTSAAGPPGDPNLRGLGWDLDSTYSSNRGDLLPLGSFGHTGFTGTSLWVDPATRIFIIFLSNRVHPDGAGDVTPVRAEVASVVAGAFVAEPSQAAREAQWSRTRFASQVHSPAPPPDLPTLAGIDVLRAEQYAPLRGLRVGLVTNQAGRARDGVSTVDLLASAPGVTLAALFSPEHGLRGDLDAAVPSAVDAKTGLPIYSLYGRTERPTDAMLQGLDAIVIDLPDVGTRFYTFMTTMEYVLEAAAAHKIKVVVLDRPNPIGGVAIEGPPLDPDDVGFTGSFPAMPIRHGLTMGELARLFNGEKGIGADLTVVPLQHWRRDEWFDQTGLAWVNPSPNMRNLYEATLYPGIGAFEGTNLSVGRGTDTPFEQIGAPWIANEASLAETLNARRLPGVRFYPVRFTPTADTFVGQECRGVFIVVTDRTAVSPVRVGVEIASALVRADGAAFDLDAAARLFGSAADLARIRAGDDPAVIAASWAGADARWRRLAAKYLLYFD